jgi:hypothetical protein
MFLTAQSLVVFGDESTKLAAGIIIRGQSHTAPTPSPRLSGERVGVRGFDIGNNGLLTPALSSFGEEREKNRAVRGCAHISNPFVLVKNVSLRFNKSVLINRKFFRFVVS